MEPLHRNLHIQTIVVHNNDIELHVIDNGLSSLYQSLYMSLDGHGSDIHKPISLVIVIFTLWDFSIRTGVVQRLLLSMKNLVLT